MLFLKGVCCQYTLNQVQNTFYGFKSMLYYYNYYSAYHLLSCLEKSLKNPLQLLLILSLVPELWHLYNKVLFT